MVLLYLNNTEYNIFFKYFIYQFFILAPNTIIMSNHKNTNCIIFDYNHDNCSNCSNCSSCNDNNDSDDNNTDDITKINSNIEDCVKSSIASNKVSSIKSTPNTVLSCVSNNVPSCVSNNIPSCLSNDLSNNISNEEHIDKPDCQSNNGKSNLSLCPECPLQLIKQIEICGTHVRDVIASISDNQILVFKNIQFIIGKCLVLVVPKIIKNNCKKYVSVELDNDVIICDINGKLVNVHVVTLCDKYYICIPIAESMMPDCELVLVIRKLKMYLNDNLCDILDNASNCESKSKSTSKSASKTKKKYKTCIDAWKWIIGSVIH